jgi:hypothetical protein
VLRSRADDDLASRCQAGRGLASDEHHCTFQCSDGVVVALYAASHYEGEFGRSTSGFCDVTLFINFESLETRVRAYEWLRSTPDVELLDEPT